jgi:hypothetical protein
VGGIRRSDSFLGVRRVSALHVSVPGAPFLPGGFPLVAARLRGKVFFEHDARGEGKQSQREPKVYPADGTPFEDRIGIALAS